MMKFYLKFANSDVHYGLFCQKYQYAHQVFDHLLTHWATLITQ